MEFDSNYNNDKKNEDKTNNYGILVPLIYIKKAILRIWNFLIKSLSIGLNCKSIFL